MVDRGVLYLDFWPVSFPMMVVLHPGISSQFTVNPSLEKFHYMRGQFGPLTAGLDMLTCKNDMWKRLRVTYNPGFSAKNMSSMAPWFIDEILTFKERLFHAVDEGKTISFEMLSLDMTLDIIGRISL